MQPFCRTLLLILQVSWMPIKSKQSAHIFGDATVHLETLHSHWASKMVKRLGKGVGLSVIGEGLWEAGPGDPAHHWSHPSHFKGWGKTTVIATVHTLISSMLNTVPGTWCGSTCFPPKPFGEATSFKSWFLSKHQHKNKIFLLFSGRRF